MHADTILSFESTDFFTRFGGAKDPPLPPSAGENCRIVDHKDNCHPPIRIEGRNTVSMNLNEKEKIKGPRFLQDNGTAFTDSDVSIFEAFAIFCGLGIHNTQMYESACKLMAKQKVALECLSYHATANNDDALRLVSDVIPSAQTYNLYSFTFIDFDLTDDDTCRATIRMFKQCDLIEKFHVPYDVLCRWILSVKKNYRWV